MPRGALRHASGLADARHDDASEVRIQASPTSRREGRGASGSRTSRPGSSRGSCAPNARLTAASSVNPVRQEPWCPSPPEILGLSAARKCGRSPARSPETCPDLVGWGRFELPTSASRTNQPLNYQAIYVLHGTTWCPVGAMWRSARGQDVGKASTRRDRRSALLRFLEPRAGSRGSQAAAPTSWRSSRTSLHGSARHRRRARDLQCASIWSRHGGTSPPHLRRGSNPARQADSRMRRWITNIGTRRPARCSYLMSCRHRRRASVRAASYSSPTSGSAMTSNVWRRRVTDACGCVREVGHPIRRSLAPCAGGDQPTSAVLETREWGAPRQAAHSPTCRENEDLRAAEQAEHAATKALDLRHLQASRDSPEESEGVWWEVASPHRPPSATHPPSTTRSTIEVSATPSSSSGSSNSRAPAVIQISCASVTGKSTLSSKVGSKTYSGARSDHVFGRADCFLQDCHHLGVVVVSRL